VADNLPDSQRTMGFSIQTFLIGLGAVIGSDLPDWLARLGVSKVAGSDGIANNIKYSFYFGAAFFIICILVTVLFCREYPPDEYKKYNPAPPSDHDAPPLHESKPGARHGVVVQIARDFRSMPKTMRQLGLVQFFSWFAMFSMWVFTTDAVATHVYGLSGSDTHSVAYNEAGNTVGSAFGIYNFVAMIYSLFLPAIAARIGRKMTHALSLLAGGVGLISIFFAHTSTALNISMIGIGIAWASILSMPYVILSSSIPAGKMGIYMGIFNFFITLPQIVNGICGGWIVKHIYGDQPIYSIVLAGFCLIAGAVSVLFVYDGGAIRIAQEKAGFYADQLS
jgi:maltose/moltooligosaccharide transporter